MPGDVHHCYLERSIHLYQAELGVLRYVGRQCIINKVYQLTGKTRCQESCGMIDIGRDFPSKWEDIVPEVPSSPLDAEKGVTFFSEQNVVIA